MRLGEAVSLSTFVEMPAEPDKRMIKCVTGEVTVYELVLRVAEYDGEDIGAMRGALSPDAQAKNVMHLVMGFDSMGGPQSILRGTDAKRTRTDEHTYAHKSTNGKSKRPLH